MITSVFFETVKQTNLLRNPLASSTTSSPGLFSGIKSQEYANHGAGIFTNIYLINDPVM